jgi:ATP-binding cassette subfamily B protein
VVALATLLKRVYGPASDLAGVHVDLMTSYAYFERVFAVLDRTQPPRETTRPVRLGRVAGTLEFRNVCFQYDAESGAALSGVDVTIDAGTTVGIVGSSGAGKTTLGALIMRLYDPTEGAVLLDGTDLRQVSLSSLRANIAVVTQETFLLHGTVLDNLRMEIPTRRRRRSRTRPGVRRSTTGSPPCRRATRPWWESAAIVSLRASGSGSPSRGRS